MRIILNYSLFINIDDKNASPRESRTRKKALEKNTRTSVHQSIANPLPVPKIRLKHLVPILKTGSY